MELDTTHLSWNGISLDSLRLIMDKPADDAVLSVYESKSMHHLRDLLVNMAQNDSLISDELPEPMREFVTNELHWKFSEEDIRMFRRSHQVWKDHGMKFCFILFFRSLPYTYMAEKPANVLRMTKLLEEQPERRVFETAQFVFDVMDEEWWTPEKRGVLTTMKVRIMHAAMRHVILEKSGGEMWDKERWGMPISQEDMIATNQTFSLEFFSGMERMGEPLTDEEKEAWHYTWNVIGRLLGIEERLLSKDIKQAWQLQYSIYEHLYNDETYAGIGLSKALVTTMSHFLMSTKFILLLLRRMLKDDLFPDCFDRLLASTYDKVYPEVFHKPLTQEDKEKHEEMLRQHFHDHLKEYHSRVKVHRKNMKKASDPGFFVKLKNWVTGKSKQPPHLVDIHLDLFHNILHHEGTDTPLEFLEEEMIDKAMSTIGGVMVGVLSTYFREGKKSGFRIPDNIRDHWSLEA